MIRLAVDGMGGDHAPKEIVLGTLSALDTYKNIEVTLFGDEEKMAPYLKDHPRLKVIHTPDFFDMGEKGMMTPDKLKQFKDTSMIASLRYVYDGYADAVISAGPTQMLVPASVLVVRRMKQMRGIAIAPFVPTVNGMPAILLDAGANIESKPEQMVSNAIYASVVLKEVFGVEKPKVGLINIGTEIGKGRTLEKETYDLLEKHPNIHFYGNLEPKEIIDGEAQVLLSDGFTANIVMKTMEGTAKAMGTILKRELTQSFFTKLVAGVFLKKRLKAFKKAMDPNEVGGAMIIGLRNIVIKAHGSSNAYAFQNAIRQAKSMVEKEVIQKVSTVLGSEPNEGTV